MSELEKLIDAGESLRAALDYYDGNGHLVRAWDDALRSFMAAQHRIHPTGATEAENQESGENHASG